MTIRALIVDDDPMTASIHRSYVERVPGFEVAGEAHSGRAALEAVRELRPDLVLLDIYLPDISGLEVLRRLREPDAPHVDVIAVTAAKDVGTLRTAIHGGVIHYLVKPFFFDTL
ncbi:MAG TPA: response regulator, partial [Gaiellaceae bacterium]